MKALYRALALASAFSLSFHIGTSTAKAEPKENPFFLAFPGL